MPARLSIFKHAQIVKLARLMDMLYTPAEIAEEIDVSVDTVKRSYVKAGLPVTKDATGHTWIHGLTFRSWAEKLNAERKKPARPKLREDQAYCLKCNKVIDNFKPVTIKPVNRCIELLQGPCPTCGRVVNKSRGIPKR